MRTKDFSKAPLIGQATAMFVGATSYKGIGSIFYLMTVWFKMVNQMQKMPGYCRHFVWYDFPLTLGTIAFFKDQDSLMRFARSKHHTELMLWVSDGTKNADGGFIRIYNAKEEGYSNGKWRAEENVMKIIERFTPVSNESNGPLVKRPDQN